MEHLVIMVAVSVGGGIPAVEILLILIHLCISLCNDLLEVSVLLIPLRPNGSLAQGVQPEMMAQIRHPHVKGFLVDPRADDDKLIPADPVIIGIPEYLPHLTGAFHQHLIPIGMAVLIIDILKAVHIQVHNTHWPRAAG